jgi:LemA protein
MSAGLITVIVVAALALFAVTIYNRIIALRQRRSNAFSDIDVQLEQRFNTLPNMVEVVKGYAAHEKGVFEQVTNARASVRQSSRMGEDRFAAEQSLSAAIMGLYAVAENYPQLKADANFRRLQDEMTDLENKISAARRFFNSATSEYNTAIQQFPATLFAAMFGFHEEPFFELSAANTDKVREVPSISFGAP